VGDDLESNDVSNERSKLNNIMEVAAADAEARRNKATGLLLLLLLRAVVVVV